MMKRIIAILTAVFLIAGLFAACKSREKNSGQAGSKAMEKQGEALESQKAENGGAVKETDGFPLTVKDANGFEMTIEKKPENIISLTLGTDEMLLDLVDKERIKALTIYADDPAISNVSDKAKDIPHKLVSEAEKVMALEPDLVFTDTWSNAEFVQQLRDAKIHVYVFKTPSNIEEQRKTVLEIAHVVGEGEKGEEIVAWMDGKLKEIEKKLAALKPEEKLKVMDYGEMGSSGRGTNFDDIVTRAGLVNVVSEAGVEGWQIISKEKIVEWNPDIFIVPSWYYEKDNTLEFFTEGIRNDKSLAVVNAVKNNRLIAISNPHISAISHYVVLGIEDTAKAVYPWLFK